MNLSFICSFIATSSQICKGPHFSLYSKKSAKQDPFSQAKGSGPNPFRINRRTTIEINLEDDVKPRTGAELVAKITRAMRKENVIKILRNRPTRRYPMHHYKRKIKQRKGFQMSDARREAYFDKHMYIPPRDDIAFLRDKHLNKIIEAVDMYDKWLKNIDDNSDSQNGQNTPSNENVYTSQSTQNNQYSLNSTDNNDSLPNTSSKWKLKE